MIMEYNWYKIFNLAEFQASELTSKQLTYELEDLGIKNILVTKGNLISILFDDVFLSVDLTGNNPFEFEDRAIYRDGNSDIWVGVKIED